jgi:hypothetical protein
VPAWVRIFESRAEPSKNARVQIPEIGRTAYDVSLAPIGDELRVLILAKQGREHFFGLPERR